MMSYSRKYKNLAVICFSASLMACLGLFNNKEGVNNGNNGNNSNNSNIYHSSDLEFISNSSSSGNIKNLKDYNKTLQNRFSTATNEEQEDLYKEFKSLLTKINQDTNKRLAGREYKTDQDKKQWVTDLFVPILFDVIDSLKILRKNININTNIALNAAANKGAMAFLIASDESENITHKSAIEKNFIKNYAQSLQ